MGSSVLSLLHALQEVSVYVWTTKVLIGNSLCTAVSKVAGGDSTYCWSIALSVVGSAVLKQDARKIEAAEQGCIQLGDKRFMVQNVTVHTERGKDIKK